MFVNWSVATTAGLKALSPSFYSVEIGNGQEKDPQPPSRSLEFNSLL